MTRSIHCRTTVLSSLVLLLCVALAACGIVLLLGLGGQRAAENAKAWIVRIVIGMMLVYMAQPLIGWVAGIAGNNAGGTGGLVE